MEKKASTQVEVESKEQFQVQRALQIREREKVEETLRQFEEEERMNRQGLKDLLKQFDEKYNDKK